MNPCSLLVGKQNGTKILKDSLTVSYKFKHLLLLLVQSLSHVQLLATPWTAARQASLSISNSRSVLKLMSIELVMSSNHLILCHPSSHPLSYKINNDIFCQQNILDFSPDIFEIDNNLWFILIYNLWFYLLTFLIFVFTCIHNNEGKQIEFSIY